MDEAVHSHLQLLSLANVSLIALKEVETPELLTVKAGRSRGEYCWTLTPFVPQFVFDRDASIQRVTYLDADLYFFGAPNLLLKEFELSGKHVLITEHAYSPEYDQSLKSGRFCVQFITVQRTHHAIGVMRWWQERCLDWCYARIENGKFGDQKYLDDWPERFTAEVHILRQREQALAPWNIRRFANAFPPNHFTFYHFHGLRILKPDKVTLYSGYRLNGLGKHIYAHYLEALKRSVSLMRAHNIIVPTMPGKPSVVNFLRNLKLRILRAVKTESF